MLTKEVAAATVAAVAEALKVEGAAAVAAVWACSQVGMRDTKCRKTEAAGPSESSHSCRMLEADEDDAADAAADDDDEDAAVGEGVSMRDSSKIKANLAFSPYNAKPPLASLF